MESAQIVFGRLKEIATDNKALWQFAQEHYEALRKLRKAEETASKIGKINFDDKESVRQAVFEHLFAESGKGNAQASHRLGEYLGLADKDRDITIEVVNYNPPAKKRRKPSTRKK